MRRALAASLLLVLSATVMSCRDRQRLSAETDTTIGVGVADDDIATGRERPATRSGATADTTAYELPATDGSDLVIRHTGYTLRYNKTHNTPDWAAWCLTAEHTDGPAERSGKFWADPSLPSAYRVEYYEYKGSGYDRGHMCPAGDMKWSEDAMHDCFYMSNMCPQAGSLNSGAWNRLEMKCREWAKKEGRIYIVCGPVWEGTRHEQIGIDHAIDVPEGFFKAILSMRKGHERTAAYYFRNDESSQSYKSAQMSVDDIERLTGLDLFASVEDNLERRIEAECKPW
ncbi:MAG: DNA/RNA non-specific endonuclease [Prevotella sp.]